MPSVGGILSSVRKKDTRGLGNEKCLLPWVEPGRRVGKLGVDM